MLLWPAGLAVVLVWQVYRDPAIDYRLVMAGAVLPDVVDGPLGGARLMHTLAASAILLGIVMLATRGRRRARRRWLAVPMGTFAHLLVDGVWAQTTTFWWPLLGGRLDRPLPAVERGPAVLLVQEVLGAAALMWLWRRFQLGDPSLRASFVRTGRLPRHLRAAPPARGPGRPVSGSELEDAPVAEPDGSDRAGGQGQKDAGGDDQQPRQ